MAKQVRFSTQSAVLAALAAGPLTTRQLAERAGVAVRGMEPALRRYVDRGLIQRRGFARYHAAPTGGWRGTSRAGYATLWGLSGRIADAPREA